MKHHTLTHLQVTDGVNTKKIDVTLQVGSVRLCSEKTIQESYSNLDMQTSC